MAEHSIIRKLVSLVTKHEIISIGTKYFPTTPLETEYVDMFNISQQKVFLPTWLEMLAVKTFQKIIAFMNYFLLKTRLKNMLL